MMPQNGDETAFRFALQYHYGAFAGVWEPLFRGLSYQSAIGTTDVHSSVGKYRDEQNGGMEIRWPVVRRVSWNGRVLGFDRNCYSVHLYLGA